jgi:hypothetical protein
MEIENKKISPATKNESLSHRFVIIKNQRVNGPLPEEKAILANLVRGMAPQYLETPRAH